MQATDSRATSVEEYVSVVSKIADRWLPPKTMGLAKFLKKRTLELFSRVERGWGRGLQPITNLRITMSYNRRSP